MRPHCSLRVMPVLLTAALLPRRGRGPGPPGRVLQGFGVVDSGRLWYQLDDGVRRDVLAPSHSTLAPAAPLTTMTPTSASPIRLLNHNPRRHRAD